MSFVDKLKFWKKDEPVDFGRDLGLPSSSLGSDPLSGGHPLGLDQGGFGNQQQHKPNPLEGFEAPSMRADSQSYNQGSFGSSMPQHQPPQQQQQGPPSSDKFEVVSAKLDSLKASIESIGTRLTNIERELDRNHNRRGGNW